MTKPRKSTFTRSQRFCNGESLLHAIPGVDSSDNQHYHHTLPDLNILSPVFSDSQDNASSPFVQSNIQSSFVSEENLEMDKRQIISVKSNQTLNRIATPFLCGQFTNDQNQIEQCSSHEQPYSTTVGSKSAISLFPPVSQSIIMPSQNPFFLSLQYCSANTNTNIHLLDSVVNGSCSSNSTTTLYSTMTEDNAPLSSNDAILTSADYLNSLALNQAQLALPQLSTHQSYPGLRHQLSGEVFYPNISQEQHHSTVAWSLVPSSTPFSLFSRESSNAASDLSFSFDQSPSLYSKLAPTLSTNVFSQQWPKQLRYTSVQSNSLFPKTEMPIFCQNSALSSNTFPDLRFPVYTITTQNQTEAHPTELCHSSSMNSAKSFMEYQQQERRSPALYPRVSFKTSRYKVDRGMATDPVTIPLPLSRIKSGILQKVRSIKQERQRRQWRLYRRIQRHRRCKRHILKRRMNVGTIDENHYKYGTLSKSHVSLLLPRKVCRKTPREVMEYLRTDAFMEEAVRSTILDQNKSMSGIKEECRAETHEEKTATPFIGSASRTTLSSSAATDAETDRIVYHGLLARIVNIDLNNIHKTEELLKIFKLKLLASILLQKHHDATDAVQNNLSDAQIIELASNKVISDVYPFGEDAYLTKSLDPRTSKILDDLLWGKSRISIPKPSAINVFTVKVPDQTPEGGSTTNEPISSPAPLSLSSPSTTNNGVTANANLSLSFVSQSVIGVPTTHDSTTMQESVATIITHQPFDSPVISTIPFATPASVSDSTSTGSIPETTVVSAINTPSLNSPQSDQVVPSIVDKSRSGTLPNSILASSQFQREKSSRPHVEFNQTRFTRYFFKSEEPERISFAKSDGVYTAGPPDEEPLIDNEGSTWRADQTVAITRRKQQSKTECKARMREELYDEEDKIVEDEIKKQEERDRRRQVVEGTADKIDEVELLDPVEEAQRQLWIKEKLEQQRIRREDQKKQREKEEQEEQKIQQEQVEQGEEEHREKEKQDQRRRIKEKLSVTALLEPSPILIPTSISTFISNISSQHPTSPPDVVLKQDLDSTIYNKTLEEEEALQEIWLAEQRQKAHEENRVCQPRAQKSSNLSIHVPLFRPTHHDDSSFSRTAMEREESEEVQREEIEKEELKKTIELSLTEYQQSRTSRVINKGKQVVRNTQHHPSQHYAGEKETGYYYKDYSDSMSHYNASEGSQRHWYADQRRRMEERDLALEIKIQEEYYSRSPSPQLPETKDITIDEYNRRRKGNTEMEGLQASMFSSSSIASSSTSFVNRSTLRHTHSSAHASDLPIVSPIQSLQRSPYQAITSTQSSVVPPVLPHSHVRPPSSQSLSEQFGYYYSLPFNATLVPIIPYSLSSLTESSSTSRVSPVYDHQTSLLTNRVSSIAPEITSIQASPSTLPHPFPTESIPPPAIYDTGAADNTPEGHVTTVTASNTIDPCITRQSFPPRSHILRRSLRIQERMDRLAFSRTIGSSAKVKVATMAMVKNETKPSRKETAKGKIDEGKRDKTTKNDTMNGPRDKKNDSRGSKKNKKK